MNEQPAFLRGVLIAVGAVILVAAIGFLIWWIVGRFNKSGGNSAMESVNFLTTDSVQIVGDLYRPSGELVGAIIYAPMMPATKESWQPLATELANRGYLGLAIDLRGHGQSTKQDNITLNYQQFSDAEHQKGSLDIEAALRYLTDHENIPTRQIGLIGASIGANLSLEVMSNHREILWSVLLSPGFDYRGVETKPALQKLAAPQRLLMVASDDDLYSYETINQLGSISPAPTTLLRLSGVGHGTTIFERDSTAQEQVINWVTSNVLKITQ